MAPCEDRSTAVQRTAELTKRLNGKYKLVLWGNGKPIKGFAIQSKDQPIPEDLEFFDEDSINLDGATYSDVAKGCSFKYQGILYPVEEDAPFEVANAAAVQENHRINMLQQEEERAKLGTGNANVPPTKKTKTEMVSTTMAELVKSGICHSLEECPVPVYPRINPPPFVCGKTWLKDMRDLVMLNVDKFEEEGAEDDDRVQPLCLARCSRGGKTRSLYSVVEGGSFDFKSLVVSFNDSSATKTAEQDDPLAALTRRIAFAAYKGQRTTDNFNEKFRHLVVSEKSVIQWLGRARCVLLIDELNNLENLASRTTASEAFADFLKENFLKVAGRYFVFTTHEVFVTGQLSLLMDSKSNRKFAYRALPFIPSLIAAQNAFSFEELNARSAIYCGLLPGLILMLKHGSFPADKRRSAVEAFLSTDYREDTVVNLLKSLVDGRRELVPKSLEQLMDASDGGELRWVPEHMANVLRDIAEQGFVKLSVDLRGHLSTIVDLFGQFKSARAHAGDGWEALFVLVLLVRVLTKETDHLIDLTTFTNTNSAYKSSYNSSITVTAKQQFEDIQDVDALMAAIPKKQDGAHVAIYYPKHASFKQYDTLVVMWNEAGEWFKTIGYQLKEGKEIPADQARSGFQNFVVRGKAAQRSNKLRNWEVPSDGQIDSFFGTSGVHWTPKRWKALKESSA